MQTQIAYAYSQRKDPNNKRDPESENENENEEKNENKQKQSWQEQWKNFIDNFWEKPDPNDPSKKPPSKPAQVLKKIEILVEWALNKLKLFTHRRFKVSSIMLALVGLYVVNSTLRSQTQLSPQTFKQMLRAGLFKEVYFVEEEFFKINGITRKKIEAKVDNQTYYCDVFSFDELLDEINQDDSIKYHNVRRTGT